MMTLIMMTTMTRQQHLIQDILSYLYVLCFMFCRNLRYTRRVLVTPSCLPLLQPNAYRSLRLPPRRPLVLQTTLPVKDFRLRRSRASRHWRKRFMTSSWSVRFASMPSRIPSASNVCTLSANTASSLTSSLSRRTRNTATTVSISSFSFSFGFSFTFSFNNQKMYNEATIPSLYPLSVSGFIFRTFIAHENAIRINNCLQLFSVSVSRENILHYIAPNVKK